MEPVEGGEVGSSPGKYVPTLFQFLKLVGGVILAFCTCLVGQKGSEFGLENGFREKVPFVDHSGNQNALFDYMSVSKYT